MCHPGFSFTCIVPCVDMAASRERSKSPTSAYIQPFGRTTLWCRLRSCISGQSCILSCRGRWCCAGAPQTSCRQSYRHLVRKHSWVSSGCYWVKRSWGRVCISWSYKICWDQPKWPPWPSLLQAEMESELWSKAHKFRVKILFSTNLDLANLFPARILLWWT